MWCQMTSGMSCIMTSGMSCIVTSGMSCIMTSGMSCIVTSGMSYIVTSGISFPLPPWSLFGKVSGGGVCRATDFRSFRRTWRWGYTIGVNSLHALQKIPHAGTPLEGNPHVGYILCHLHICGSKHYISPPPYIMSNIILMVSLSMPM